MSMMCKGLFSLLGILKETQTLCSNEIHNLERETANPQLWYIKCYGKGMHLMLREPSRERRGNIISG